jgi:hypothetical protein
VNRLWGVPRGWRDVVGIVVGRDGRKGLATKAPLASGCDWSWGMALAPHSIPWQAVVDLYKLRFFLADVSDGE